MRSLQDYRDIYSEIASKNNITGDSVELLVQLLANASYISEVENISYVTEASLEKCTLVNSKIQHCMNQMYSVFRGRCPRVILRFKATKYLEFNVYDPIVVSNDFTVYYLGYLADEEVTDSDDEEDGEDGYTGTRSLPLEDGFVYGPRKIRPSNADSDIYTIIGFIAQTKIEEEWKIDKSNTYYVETQEENLSSDMWVKLVSGEDNEEYLDTTRIFSEHILEHRVFDLTTTSFSSRLYIADLFMPSVIDRNDEGFNPTPQNTSQTLKAGYYKFSRVSDYKPAELKKINISGTEMVSFVGEFRSYSEIAPGVIIIPEVDRERIETIHYKANRDRYVGSIIRSNSDVGTVLEETFPSKVLSGGTNYVFDYRENESAVDLYYVPADLLNLLTDSEIEEFAITKKAYYIVDTINVQEGRQYTAYFNIDIELYKSYDISKDISDVLKNYEKRFGVNLENKKDEIQTLISKVSNIKQVKDIEISYLPPNSETPVDPSELLGSDGSILPDIYFKIEYNINSIVQTRS